MQTLSFCIPCYRSEKTIGNVINEIEQMVMSKPDEYDYEVVAVVDGSPDGVFSVLKELALSNSKIKVVNLAKNFSQANARMASLKYSTGDIVICLDDDGQCPMDKLWDLIEPLNNGKDVSVADYPKKKQSAFKNLGSKVNKLMSIALLQIPKDFTMTNFFALRRYVVNRVLEYKNPYPYFTGLLMQTTNNIATVKMEERDRASGTTGYTLKKLLSLWMNGFTNFSIKPLRIANFVGILCAIFGFGFGASIVVKKLMGFPIQEGYSSVIASIFFIGGIIMLLLGMIGEYVGRIFMCINNTPQYVVKEVLNIDEI